MVTRLRVVYLRELYSALVGTRPHPSNHGWGRVDALVFNRAEDRWELEGDWGFAGLRTPEVVLRFGHHRTPVG
jgi:hypothetical protein